MKRSYEEAALYALAVILVVLWIDFRSIRYSLLAALPLALGLLQMFGIMGLMKMPLNPANMIALPLVLGIGVDCGVHLIHDFLEQKGRYRMSSATAISILLDGTTTIVGFGSLMIASHMGLQSLGRALAIGVTGCMLSSFCVLPPILALLSWNRGADSLEGTADDASRATRNETRRAQLRVDSPSPAARRAS
jgi:predicted RND superfamily exporter protein